MILTLRQRHRRVFAVLGVLLPVVFVAGIAARKPVPNVGSLPPELRAASGQFSAVEWERSDLFAKAPVYVRLSRERAGVGRFAVALTAAGDFVKPDLIVYWAAGNSSPADKLREDATLLGSFSAGELPLPTESASMEGRLILFSLADNKVVDVSRPVRFNDSAK